MLIGFVLVAIDPAEAQQANIPRVAIIFAGGGSPAVTARIAVSCWAKGTGYREGKNIIIEHRYADGQLDRIPRLVNEVIRLKVDVIVSGGPAVTRPTKERTSTIPIVVGFDNDPVG